MKKIMNVVRTMLMLFTMLVGGFLVSGVVAKADVIAEPYEEYRYDVDMDDFFWDTGVSSQSGTSMTHFGEASQGTNGYFDMSLIIMIAGVVTVVLLTALFLFILLRKNKKA